jgi:single-stranded-DNA-specific exonuclease
VFKNGWHKGVIGIVASRLIETHYRPTIVLTEHEGKVTGSGRSVKGFDLYEAIYNCKDHLIQFGGHKFAAGLTMLPEKVDDFANAFEEEVSKTITPEQLIPEIEIDAEISLDTITDKYFNIIKRFEPFGPDNMKPHFLVRNVQDTGWSKVVKEKHLKVSVKKGQAQLSGIGFNMAEKLRLLKEGNVDIVFQIEENEWQGQITLQLMVKDIAKSGEKLLKA